MATMIMTTLAMGSRAVGASLSSLVMRESVSLSTSKVESGIHIGTMCWKSMTCTAAVTLLLSPAAPTSYAKNVPANLWKKARSSQYSSILLSWIGLLSLPKAYAYEMKGQENCIDVQSRENKEDINCSTDKREMSDSKEVEKPTLKSSPLMRLVIEFWPEIVIAVIMAAAAAIAASFTPTLLGKLYDVAAAAASKAEEESSLQVHKSLDNDYDRYSYSEIMSSIRVFLTRSKITPIMPFLRTGGAFLGAAILRAMSFRFVMSLGMIVQSRLQYMLVDATIRQDLAYLDSFDRPGQLADQIRSDVSEVKRLATSLATAVAAVGQVCIGVAMMSATSPKLAVIIMCSLPPGVTIAVGSLHYVIKSRAEEKKVKDVGNSLMLQSINGIRTVRSFANEERETTLYEKHLSEWSKYYAAAATATSFHAGLFMMLQLGAICSWLYAGAILCSNGQLTVGQLSSIIQHSQALGVGMASLSSLHEQVARAGEAAARIYSLLDAETIIEGTKGYTPSECSGVINFINVNFSYPSRPQETVLKSLNLELRPGMVTALVGGSGSGKSTITVLLQRFYDPNGGYITLNEIPLSEHDLHWLRSHITVVSQEPQLFPGSIEDNIRYGKPFATREEVIEAAKLANAHDFIQQLHDGYATKCGDRGAELSGGQKQRIAIARALLLKPQILVLDEATSALDVETERSVQESIHNLMKDIPITVLVIAHRLETIQNADQICVMKDGSLVEKGTHEELLNKNGYYATLLRKNL